MSKQMEDIKETKLLDSHVHLCQEIRKLLRKKRNLPFTQEYTEYDIVHIALNRLMSEFSRH